MRGRAKATMDELAKIQTVNALVVRYLTTNANSNTRRMLAPFALRYRRANGEQIRLSETLLKEIYKEPEGNLW